MTNHCKIFVLWLLVAAATIVTAESDANNPDISFFAGYLDSVRHLMDDGTFHKLSDALEQEAHEEESVPHPAARSCGEFQSRQLTPTFTEDLDLTPNNFLFLPQAVFDQNDVSTVDSASYDGTMPLYIVISDYPALLVQHFVKKHMDDSDSRQVLLVNWGGLFESFEDPSAASDQSWNVTSSDFDLASLKEIHVFRMPDYRSLVRQVSSASDATIQMVKTMQSSSQGLTMDNVHVVCSGVGCQIAALVAQEFSGQFATITALSPAKVRFTGKAASGVLDCTDAQFVVGVHGEDEHYGIETEVGDADIYLVMDPQPGDYFFCPYVLSVMAFTAADMEYGSGIRPAAYKCISQDHFLNGECSYEDLVHLGFEANSTARGKYYHKLNLDSPQTAWSAQRDCVPNDFSAMVDECTNGYTDETQLLTSVQRLALAANPNNPGIVEVFDGSHFVPLFDPDVPRTALSSVILSPSLTDAATISEQAVADGKINLQFRFRNDYTQSGNFTLNQVVLEDFTDNSGPFEMYVACNVVLEPWLTHTVELTKTTTGCF